MRKLAALLAGTLLLTTALCGCEDEPEEAQTSLEPEPQVQTVQAGDLGTGLVLGEMEGQLDEDPERKVHRAAIPVGFRPAVTMTGAVLGEEHYYYRSTLTPQGQKGYDQIRAGLLEGRAVIEMSVPLSVDDAFMVYQMVVYDGPELFYATNGCSCTYNNYGTVLTITPGYNELVYDIQGYTQQLQASVAEAVAAMQSLEEPLFQVKYAHDYLTHTINYVSGSPHNQNCYSALVLKQTVCAGYAHAMQYLLQQVGIPCAYVIGFAGEAHAWNILQLYGETYAMDVTWDDPVGNAPDTYYYGYFNITDDQLASDHSRDSIAQPLPWAYGTACSYDNGFAGNAYGTDFSGLGSGGYPQPEDIQVPEDYLPEDGDADEFYPEDYVPEDLFPEEDWWEDDWWEDEDLWWEDDTSWDDSYADQWWSLLDDSWSQEDWTQEEPGIWTIWDDESWCWYMWDENEGGFYALDGETETEFWLDMDSGEWIEIG